jgi:hypothetical protein
VCLLLRSLMSWSWCWISCLPTVCPWFSDDMVWLGRKNFHYGAQNLITFIYPDWGQQLGATGFMWGVKIVWLEDSLEAIHLQRLGSKAAHLAGMCRVRMPLPLRMAGDCKQQMHITKGAPSIERCQVEHT